MSLRLLLFAVFVSVGMSSCVNYQYLTVSSKLDREDDKGFVLETDSVQVSYQFNGTNGPVQIEVLNKTSHPLYLDWSKSAIVVNGEVHPYWKNESSISAVADGSTVATDRRTTYSSQAILGKLTRPSRTDFIPPNSTLKRAPVALSPDFFDHPPSSQNKRTEGKGALVVVIYEYDSSNSPLQFRSYLTISRQSDFRTVSTFDHAFWISSVHRADHSLDKQFADERNTFRVVHAKATSNATTGIAAAGQ